MGVRDLLFALRSRSSPPPRGYIQGNSLDNPANSRDKKMAMPSRRKLSRRKFMQHSASLAAAGAMTHRLGLSTALLASGAPPPLEQFGYADVTLSSEPHETQLHESHAVLMGLSDDSLLKPFRQMAGQPAPGEDLSGWFNYTPNFDTTHTG